MKSWSAAVTAATAKVEAMPDESVSKQSAMLARLARDRVSRLNQADCGWKTGTQEQVKGIIISKGICFGTRLAGL
jgi:hypothetical protein